MTSDAEAAAPTPLPGATRMRIFAYLGVLILLLGFGAPNGSFIETPITFFLKNRLHLAAHQAALFRLLGAIPLYLAFVFGFVRDTVNPFGMRDRGFLVLFGARRPPCTWFSPLYRSATLASWPRSSCRRSPTSSCGAPRTASPRPSASST